MDNFKIKDPPEYNDVLRMLETSDRARADIFNILFEQLVNNDAFLRKFLEKLEETAKKHIEDDDLHVTAQNKEDWNAKAETTAATQSAAGLMSAKDKKKLDGVAENAEVNQNAYSNIKVGSVTITANRKTSTLTLEAGANITISADNASKKITITADKNGGNADMVDGYHAAHFANADHAHDGRYNTKGEITTLLNQKAASSHTHDNRYYTEAEVNNLLANKAASMVVSEGDYNNMKTPGLYTMRTITTNSPDGGGYFGLLVLKSDNGDYVEQIAVKESSGNVYVRYLSGSSWSAWKLLANGSIYGNDGISLKRIGDVGSRSIALGAYEVKATGANSFATGWQTEATGDTSATFGYLTKATALRSFACGDGSVASGIDSYAEGLNTVASGVCSHASGDRAKAIGNASYADGQNTEARGFDSHASGDCTKAIGYINFVIGKYNLSRDTNPNECLNDLFVIGGGASETARSNAFRVNWNGYVYCKGSYGSGGADYAEYYEWQDGNPARNDRVGHFVTLNGDKIQIASSQDYILGIVSAFPCLIGNSDEEWQGRWKKDIFGRLIRKEVQVPITKAEEVTEPILDEEGNETGEVNVVGVQEISTGEFRKEMQLEQVEGYDPMAVYIERKDRPEWAAIGMLGVLAVYDDGSCQVNGYCKVADGGIATAADGEYMLSEGKIFRGYRVIERVAENIIKVVFR